MLRAGMERLPLWRQSVFSDSRKFRIRSASPPAPGHARSEAALWFHLIVRDKRTLNLWRFQIAAPGPHLRPVWPVLRVLLLNVLCDLNVFVSGNALDIHDLTVLPQAVYQLTVLRSSSIDDNMVIIPLVPRAALP